MNGSQSMRHSMTKDIGSHRGPLAEDAYEEEWKK